MKKIISFIMAVMLTATTYGFVGTNEDFGASTVYAAEAFNSDDFEIKNNVIVKCSNQEIRSVVIPDNIVGIEPEAFKGCTELETVEMTNSVRWIGENAFQYCFSLKDVTVSSFITNGREIFSDCIIDWSIENGYSSDGFNVTFSDSEIVKHKEEDEAEFNADMYVRGSAFQDCEYVKSVLIPENYVYVEDGAFVHCSNLKKATLPSTLKKYDNNAFSFSPTVISVTGATFGDANNDGSLTSADLMRLRKYLLGNDMTIMNSDMNQDDRINIIDLIKLVSLFLDE